MAATTTDREARDGRLRDAQRAAEHYAEAAATFRGVALRAATTCRTRGRVATDAAVQAASARLTDATRHLIDAVSRVPLPGAEQDAMLRAFLAIGDPNYVPAAHAAVACEEEAA